MTPIYLVPTDNGTHERHEGEPPPMCDYEGPLFAIPPGWKLVPAEPTEAMKVAALNDLDPLGKLIDWQSPDGTTREAVAECYAAMIATAPEPPDNAGLSCRPLQEQQE